ncbi:valine--tRNA ligase [Halobacteriales archaeon SW_7_71_33]|nr:MAG: valine--tRNA ligase [Halobacteriales archaeon SW_7_71_33]
MSTQKSETDDRSTQRDDPTLDGEYDPAEAEPRWQQHWVEDGTYAYDEVTDPNRVYSIDTPPPTVSGDLHMGHLYGHTLQDFVARYRRMRGEETFFPFGYDDNGIASERLTESELGIRHQEFSRQEFQERTREVCREYEAEFTEKMQSLATSIDWDRTYKTIEPRVQRVSQLSFVDLYEKDREYRQKAPAIWCPDCETAISQVEMEGAERSSHENDVAFELVEPGSRPPADAAPETPTETGDDLVITTTRPELLPACVAMIVHPEDEDRAHLVGGTARVPLFGHEVPIIADERVDPDAGTGMVMSCTFGDQTDIEWYQAHDLDLRVAIDESGTLTSLAGEYAGMTTHEAREAIAEDLDDAGRLLRREPIQHTVQVHERCEEDIEFRVTEQWYVKLLDKKEAYLEAGEEMDWYPEKMQTRYEHWIEGLEWDWCVSRQRDSGIPFPVWYCGDCGETVVADRSQLPVDPIADEPPVDACPTCGHEAFEAEEDVFDTWATSSLTPLINAGWDHDPAADPADPAAVGAPPAEDADAGGAYTLDNPELYPFDLRPQGHDIISFWLFHTVVKCVEHTGEVPFEAVLVNGHVLDENRKKMSSSKGNVVPPEEVMDDYPVDAIRYWAASSAVGDDFPFKTNELTQGEKLIRKVWNASKLVDTLAPADPEEPDEFAPIDRWMLATVDDLTERLTGLLDDNAFARARDELRSTFWHTFCDDYLEIAKQRLRDGEDPSAAYALTTAHRTFLTLFAPLLPHVTEEVYRARYADLDGDGDAESLHLTDWPAPRGYDADLRAGETALGVIGALRKYKSERQLPLNADLARVEVYGDVAGFEDAVRETMHVRDLDLLEEAPEITERVAAIDFDYSTLGPKYGEKVGAFDAAIDAGEYEIIDEGLRAAGETLDPDSFEVERERTYGGEGEMVETDGAVIVVHE